MTGSYDVPADQGGMFALVFDNTFSKQVSKTVTLVLMTYLTNAPPQTSHQLHNARGMLGAAGSTTSLGSKPSPLMSPAAADSTDSLPDKELGHGPSSRAARHDLGIYGVGDGQSPEFLTGTLLKRRRKRHQGYARRFFSLDYTTSTLSYYHNPNSSALRGAIPLSLAAVGANEKTREISVDSGVEVWHLRASNAKEFTEWKDALERASEAASNQPTTSPESGVDDTGPKLWESAATEEQEWSRIEALVGKIAGTRDAVRRLANATKFSIPQNHLGRADCIDASPPENHALEYFQEKDRKPFWKRKTSSGSSSSALRQKASSGQLHSPNTIRALTSRRTPGKCFVQEENMHDHCAALLRDLDSVVGEFSQLIAESRRRRMQRQKTVLRMSQRSLDTVSTGEFYDADEGRTGSSQLLSFDDAEDDEGKDSFGEDDAGSGSDSDAELPRSEDRQLVASNGHPSLFPQKPKSLSPLPLQPVKRRSTIPPSVVMPPSLIGFLRKNVGKDLSTVSMPISANEPISLLQRVSEQLEYSSLLDAAASHHLDRTDRLLYITAFAISTFSNARLKERAIRKPFNPMLGETFELIREDQGFRLLAEKVSHRPVRMACQAESQTWSFSQSPMPTQKFWGKSVELITEGKVRVVLHPTGDCFSWALSTSFLRNIIAGEKYVEPVGSMTILHETTGQKAIVTFKTKGMFSGRSEDVCAQLYDRNGAELPAGLIGKWTLSLDVTRHGGSGDAHPIWTVGALVDNAPAHYGFTTFAASLNEITPVEADKLPPTDSRLRPDQRKVEQGDLDGAEVIKARLEEQQRVRRARLEDEGAEWVPRWFERVGGGGGGDGAGEDVWRLKTGRNGYWEERERGEWSGVVDVFRS